MSAMACALLTSAATLRTRPTASSSSSGSASTYGRMRLRCSSSNGKELATPDWGGQGKGRGNNTRQSARTKAQSGRSITTLITSPPPCDTTSSASWDDPLWSSPLDPARQIFCNRSLNMAHVKAVGFDMDYTLAQYKEETFEKLAYEETVKKLIEHCGYPECIAEFEFDTTYMVRGLVIDKARGNMLKMDRHKYVKIAYHGFAKLPVKERMDTYNNQGVRDSFDGNNYANIDTLFSLAEAYLFCQLVELKDEHPGKYLTDKAYFDLYTEIRRAVDLCHRDGSIKVAVANNPGYYIHEDKSLLPLLKMIQDSGRKTFIVTNSLWDYTNVVMNFLLEGKKGKEIDHSWLQYFDVVIAGSKKPSFFHDGNILFEVDLPTGLLHNTDNGSPLVQLDTALVGEETSEEDEAARAALAAPAVVDGVRRARVFQGGTFRDLHSMLGVRSGSEVLYVGDHIYGDILRSKKTLGWRTLVVVPELETELRTLIRTDVHGSMATFRAWRSAREQLDDNLQRLQWSLRNTTNLNAAAQEEMEASIAELTEERDAVRKQHRSGLREYHEMFHPVWGQLMLTGYQASRFMHQIQRFACLYTSHVSNLRAYSPDKSYRSADDVVPHFARVPGGQLEIQFPSAAFDEE